MSCTGFDASNYLKLDSGIITAAPLTIAAWIRDTTTNMGGAIAGVYTSTATTNRHSFKLMLNSGNARAQTADGSGGASATSVNEMVANTWHHACAVFASATSRTAYMDGDTANKGTNTTSKTPTGINRTAVGIDYASTPGLELDSTAAQVADLCFWNIALSDTEVVAIAKGIFPFLIHPESIVAYFPLIGKYRPEINLKSNSAVLTAQGTINQGTSHPRIYPYPSSYNRRYTTAVAAASTAKYGTNRLLLGVGF